MTRHGLTGCAQYWDVLQCRAGRELPGAHRGVGKGSLSSRVARVRRGRLPRGPDGHAARTRHQAHGKGLICADERPANPVGACHLALRSHDIRHSTFAGPDVQVQNPIASLPSRPAQGGIMVEEREDFQRFPAGYEPRPERPSVVVFNQHRRELGHASSLLRVKPVH